MVDIEYDRLKKLAVHEIYKLPVEDLIIRCISQDGIRPIYWCDGVLFFITYLSDARLVDKEYAQGTLHWAEFYYSEKREYEPTLELNREPYRGAKAIVKNTSNFELHKEFIAWLKKNHVSKGRGTAQK